MTAAKGNRILAPAYAVGLGSTPTASSFAIDVNNDGIGWTCQAKNTEAITHLGFRYGARTGTPPTYSIGIEGFSATTGYADGTYLGGGSPASATFTPPADATWDGTWQWIALTNSYTPTLGEIFVVTIRAAGSPDPDGSNNSSFTTQWASVQPSVSNLPYASRLTAGTWAIQTTNAYPCFGIRTANTRYGSIFPNLYATRSASTVGRRVAMQVDLPAGFGDTFQVAGVRMICSPAAAVAKNPLIKIWSASSALASMTFDTDLISSSGYRVIEARFTSLVSLNFGTTYYFGVETADATNGGIILYGVQYASSSDKNSDDGGSYVSFATYDGSNWSQDATVRPWMELILEDWTEPSGGGGIIMPARSRVFSPMGSY